jgi:hypothetical protein
LVAISECGLPSEGNAAARFRTRETVFYSLFSVSTRAGLAEISGREQDVDCRPAIRISGGDTVIHDPKERRENENKTGTFCQGE